MINTLTLKIIKLFTFKHGALAFNSSISSVFAIYTAEYFAKNYEVDKILISVFSFIGMMFIFSFFSISDLITGIQVALLENKESENPQKLGEVIKSKKLWATIWKGFAVFMITSLFCFIGVLGVLLKSDIIFFTAVYLQITFSFMACGFEFYSIGENTAKLNNGKKKSIYLFFEKILTIIEQRIINRVETHNNNKNE